MFMKKTLKAVPAILIVAALLVTALLCPVASASKEETDGVTVRFVHNGIRENLSIRECGFDENHQEYSVVIEGYSLQKAAQNGSVNLWDAIPFTVALAWDAQGEDYIVADTLRVTADPVTIVLFDNKNGSPLPDPEYIVIAPKDWLPYTGFYYVIAEGKFYRRLDLVEALATPTPAPLPAKEAVDPREHPEALKTAGEYVTFGCYPQTEEGTDRTPIEWLVLDVQDGKALLLSRYGLEARAYHEPEYFWKKDVTWEECQLRAWLNGEFVDTAFTPEELSAIRVTEVDNSDAQKSKKVSTDGGNNTQDRVYLLSYAEAVRYFNASWDDENMASRAAPTAYAVKQGTILGKLRTETGELSAWWWLRSPGAKQNMASTIRDNGCFNYAETDFRRHMVRPVLWVDTEAAFFTGGE